MASPVFNAKNRAPSPDRLASEVFNKLKNPAVISKDNALGIFILAALSVDASLAPRFTFRPKLTKVYFVPLEKQESVPHGPQVIALIPERVNPWITKALEDLGCTIVLGIPDRFDRILA